MICKSGGFTELSHSELESIDGGNPIAIAALLVTSFLGGYTIGRDIANNKK